MDERDQNQRYDERENLFSNDERSDTAWLRTRDGYRQNNEFMLNNQEMRRNIYAS